MRHTTKVVSERVRVYRTFGLGVFSPFGIVVIANIGLKISSEPLS